MPTPIVIFVIATYLLSACSPGTDTSAIESPGEREQNAVDSTPDQRVDDVATTLPNLGVESSTASPALNVGVADQRSYIYEQLIPRDGILPIYNPVFESVTQAALQDEELVMGLTLNGESKAYPISVLRWAADKNFHAYLQRVGDQELTFEIDGENIVDLETGTQWDIARGLATEGPLLGESLQPIPSSTSYDWAWFDFYPQSEMYVSLN